MIPIVSLLLVLYLSLIITRVATIALVHTGMSREEAQLQARSAFSGCGFTTKESEKMVNHPVRRRILMLLMLFGNVGIVTALSSVVLGFIDIGKRDEPMFGKLLVLFIGLAVLWYITASSWIDKQMSRVIEWMLNRYTTIKVRDYVHLVHLSDDYKIAEIVLRANDWATGKTLSETRLSDEGLLVLAIIREDGEYIGAPRGDTRLLPNDTLVIYGQSDAIAQLDQRESGMKGDMEHEAATKREAELRKQRELIHRNR